MENILNNLKTSQLLRISCSDIAGVTGFNPWSKIDELFEKYLYQDLDELMASDAECLDTEFLTTEQEIQKILQKIDSKDKEQFDAIDAVTKDSTVLNNNTKAEDMLKQIQQLMKDSGIVNKISSSELKFMENEFKGRVRKNYGVHCENASLDKYEQVMGFAVTDRNMETLKMKVMPEIAPSNSLRTKSCSLSALDASTEADHPPVDAFAVLINGSKRLSKEAALAAQTGVKKRRTHDKPSFVLIGRVDGISRQLDMSSDDASQWGENKVVVEMKSRVRGISSPPPLYEQIQLVAYMIMLECSCGDLVQAVARKEEKRSSVSVAKSEVEVVCLEEVLSISSTTEDKVSSVSIVDNVKSSAVNGSDNGGTGGRFIDSRTAQQDESVSMCTSAEDCTPESMASTQSSTDACSYLAETVCSSVGSVSSSTATASTSTIICKTSTHITTAQSATTTFTMHTAASSMIRAATSPTARKATTAASTTTTSATSIKTETKYQPRPRRHDPSVMYSDEEFQVNRIQLDGPPYHHRKYWDNVVMPRLRLFRDAVAVMRSDDSVRYAYLMSGPEEKVKMLQTFCPYFDV